MAAKQPGKVGRAQVLNAHSLGASRAPIGEACNRVWHKKKNVIRIPGWDRAIINQSDTGITHDQSNGDSGLHHLCLGKLAQIMAVNHAPLFAPVFLVSSLPTSVASYKKLDKYQVAFLARVPIWSGFANKWQADNPAGVRLCRIRPSPLYQAIFFSWFKRSKTCQTKAMKIQFIFATDE